MVDFRAAILASAAGALVLAAGATGAAQPSVAPPPPPQQEQASGAEALYQQAEALAAVSRHAEAYEAYRGAWAERKDARTAARLGEIELQQGEATLAAAHFGFVVRVLLEQGGDPDALAKAQERFAEARRAVFALTVRVSAPRAEVWVDAVRAGFALDSSLYLTPGPHDLEILSAGYVPQRFTIEATPGGAREVSIALVPARPIPPRAERPVAPRVPPQREKSVGFIVGGVVGGAGLVVLGTKIHQDDTGDDAVGVATAVVGGALLTAVGLYVLWPEPEVAPERAAPRVPDTKDQKWSAQGWLPNQRWSEDRWGRELIPQKGR